MGRPAHATWYVSRARVPPALQALTCRVGAGNGNTKYTYYTSTYYLRIIHNTTGQVPRMDVLFRIIFPLTPLYFLEFCSVDAGVLRANGWELVRRCYLVATGTTMPIGMPPSGVGHLEAVLEQSQFVQLNSIHDSICPTYVREWYISRLTLP